jgi:hypothetical protein
MYAPLVSHHTANISPVTPLTRCCLQCLFPNEQDIPVVVFRTKMQRILENAYAHLPDCNQHEVSCYVDDILSALDPHNTECIDVQECIRILSAPYNQQLASAVTSVPAPLTEIHET